MNQPKVLYICSAARCGSTIADMFLGSHSQVASLGEVNFLGKAIKRGEACTCGEPVVTCPAWQRIYDAIRNETGVNLPDEPYKHRLWDALARVAIDSTHQNALFYGQVYFRRIWLTMREALPIDVRLNFPIPPSYEVALHNKRKLYELLAKIWGKSVIVDSSKNPWEAVELATRWPEEIKVVLMTRDGRGVYLSRRSSGFSRRVSVLGWIKYYRRAAPMLLKRLPPSNLLQMRYEDLATNPEGLGRKLCEFVSLDYETSMLAMNKAERHMVNGNDTRFAPSKEIRLDERWRRQLVGDELAYFERHGGALNRVLGYR